MYNIEIPFNFTLLLMFKLSQLMPSIKQSNEIKFLQKAHFNVSKQFLHC